MDRFHFLPFYEMKLESSDENGQKHQSLSNRESPSGTLSFPSKAKWLVSEAWKLFDVFRAETIRIKPKTGISISYNALASQKAIHSIRDLKTLFAIQFKQISNICQNNLSAKNLCTLITAKNFHKFIMHNSIFF